MLQFAAKAGARRSGAAGTLCRCNGLWADLRTRHRRLVDRHLARAFDNPDRETAKSRKGHPGKHADGLGRKVVLTVQTEVRTLTAALRGYLGPGQAQQDRWIRP